MAGGKLVLTFVPLKLVFDPISFKCAVYKHRSSFFYHLGLVSNNMSAAFVIGIILTVTASNLTTKISA